MQSNAPAQTLADPPAPESGHSFFASWLSELWHSPVLRWLTGAGPLESQEPEQQLEPQQDAEALTPPPVCSVAPLEPITDPDAMALEKAEGPAVNTQGLTPRAFKALGHFVKLIVSRGGSVQVTSAYRPEAYQQHLRDVWYKWMTELRNNEDPACATLKAEVGEEFTRHQLLPSQHPVVISDHSLGIGFDAAVTLPPPPRTKKRARRRGPSVDRLARLAGLSRPDIARDPVHFRVIGARPAAYAKAMLTLTAMR